jgi:hypothetical protein
MSVMALSNLPHIVAQPKHLPNSTPIDFPPLSNLSFRVQLLVDVQQGLRTR